MINKFGQYVFFGLIIFITLYYIFFKFFFSYNSVKIKQIEREQDNDLLFILEFLLVDLKSGSNLGMSIENLSKIKRPTSRFFKNILLDIKIGTDIENSIKNSINYCASYNLKVIMKRIYDSLEIGGNLDLTIENQIKEFSQKKIIKIKGYSKKINPLVTVYLTFRNSFAFSWNNFFYSWSDSSKYNSFFFRTNFISNFCYNVFFTISFLLFF